MFPLKKAILLFAVLFFMTPLYSQNFQGKKKDIQKILKNIENFSQYYIAGDVQKLVDCYTSDGMIMPNTHKILDGKGLEKYWTRPDNKVVLSHKINPVEIKIIKKYAYDYGYYEGSHQVNDGDVVHWKGKYVIVWKKVGKEWKIYLDIWNLVNMK